MRHKDEYLFLFGVGGAYLFAVVRVIISATVIPFTNTRLYLMGLLALLIFTAILFNRITRYVSLGVLVLAAAFVLLQTELRERLFYHIDDVISMTTGNRPFQPELGTTLLWAVVLGLGFVTVVFTLYRFSFMLLATAGLAIFTVSWLSTHVRDSTAFFVFIFAFLLIFVRKMTGRIATAGMAAPLALIVIIIANLNVPLESDAFERRTFRDALEGRFVAIEDFFFELFNPMYFSFAQTGFSGQGGRLGGPIDPNNARIMEVSGPGMLYLSGATHNYFTGYAWRNTLQDGDIDHHGLQPGHFEMLEQAAALIYGTRFVRETSTLTAGILRDQFADEFAYHLNPLHFSTAQAWVDHVFLPFGRIYVRDIFPGQRMYIPYPLPDVIDIRITPRLLDGEWIFFDAFTLTGAYLEYDEGEFDHTQALLIPYILHDDYRAWSDLWRASNPHQSFIPRPNQHGSIVYYVNIYLPLETASIALGRNRTGTIFRPISTMRTWFDPTVFDYGPALTANAMGDISTPGFMRRGTVYHHQFLHINPNLNFVVDILHDSHAGLYAARAETLHMHPPTARRPSLASDAQSATSTPLTAMEELLATFMARGTPSFNYVFPVAAADQLNALVHNFSAYSLADYANSVRTHFLQVPDITPQRVHDLTHNIIRYETTDFGRVMAIRDFLVRSFPYTLNPAHVPPGVCFVDFFLFEGQEGYCTYFASAMALMSRIAGVPARYAEGFVVAGQSRHEHNVTQVTNRMAHAWVEVYFEGFGWLTVEATPPYAASLAATGDAPPIGGGTSGGWWGWEEPDWNLYADFWPEGGGGGGGITTPPPIVEATPRSLFFYLLLFALLILALILLIIAAVLLAGRFRTRLALRRLSKLDRNQQTQAYFKGILSISEYYHLQLTQGETTLMYSNRAGKRFAFQSDAIFLRDLIALYNRARYSNHPITPKEATLMQTSYQDMLDLLRAMRIKPHFLYLRHVKKIGALHI
ncbi:MAG: transglutaminase domain-containing protein [Defluviitaleaceae bacterium]|nr:transglutaminase domain-containing protein [Defluviitaleaceae bacterium]